MDFELDEELVAVRDLARDIVADHATPERITDVENAREGFDRELWQLLAGAGLLGIALPEEAGGDGLGALGLVTLLEQLGRRVPPVPVAAVLAGAALPLARWGSAQLQQRWLPGILDGTAPVVGDVDSSPGRQTAVRADRTGEELVLHGEVTAVPGAGVAAALVLPVDDAGTPRLAVVPTDAAGLTLVAQRTTDRTNHAAAVLDGVRVPATAVLDSGEEAVTWMVRRVQLASAALQLGVCAEALQQTAAYTSQREQFGRALSTNQAVAVRAADAHLDTGSLRLTVQHAAWLLDQGREQEADPAVLVAQWWASRGGLRVVHATQHLHGGIGADVDYPIHRYFLWGRQLAFSMGSADALAAELGDRLPDAPAIGAPA